jgi:hypothetical protein
LNKKHIYIEDKVSRALKLKIDEGLPHIHFSIEENCDPFTSALIWIEVLSRGVEAALIQGACVISYSDPYVSKGQLSSEECDIIKKMQKNLDKKLSTVEIIDNRK